METVCDIWRAGFEEGVIEVRQVKGEERSQASRRVV
jgi:hypothetical protein